MSEHMKRKTSFSEIAHLKSEVSSLESATATFNTMLKIVILRFKLNSQEGFFILKANETDGLSAADLLRNKLVAVGRTQLAGKRPADMSHIAKIMKNGIGKRSLHILLNGLHLVGGEYGDMKWGAAAR